MSSVIELQEDILRLFCGQETKVLSAQEKQNLLVYKGLAISAAENMLAKIFKEIHAFYKDSWRQIIMDYLEHFPSRSPIYSELAQDFASFLDSDFFKNKYPSNNYLAQVATYKWLDLKIHHQPQKKALANGLIQNYQVFRSKFNIPLLLEYLNSKQYEIVLTDDIEEQESVFFIYRYGLTTKICHLNAMTLLFIEKLQTNLELEQVEQEFILQYQSSCADIEQEVKKLVNYLKNMKILLV